MDGAHPAPRDAAGNTRHVPGGRLRLADLLASLSLVADLGFGLPAENSMRACLISTALARRLGLAAPEVTQVFYTALLQHIGCTGFAHETSVRYGDEMAVNAAAARTNLADPRDVLATYLPRVTRGRGPLDRVRIVLLELLGGDAFGRQYATAACDVGRRRRADSDCRMASSGDCTRSTNGGTGRAAHTG